MDDGDRMPKVSLDKEGQKLTNIEKEYMQRLQRQNIERIQKLNLTRRKNRIVGTVLGLGVISIYSYTIWAIKQESFLDDFNEPEKVNE